MLNKLWKVGWVATLLGACSDNNPQPTGANVVSTNTNAINTTSNATMLPVTTSNISPAATTEAVANSVTTTATTPTVQSSSVSASNTTTTNIQTTTSSQTPTPPQTTGSATTARPPTTVATTTSTAQTAAATTPTGQTTAATSTQVSQRHLLGNGQGKAFGMAANGSLYFYERIAGRVGTYTYDLTRSNSQLQFLTATLGLFTPDLNLVAVADKPNNVTYIEQVANGMRRAILQNRASATLISPDKTRLAYLLRSLNQDTPEAPQYFELWVGNLDGSALKKVWDLREGAGLTWFPNSHRLLLTARDQTNQRFGLWAVDVDGPVGQNAQLLVESKGLIQARLSSDGARVVYAIAFEGATNSGVWSATIDGNNKHKFDWTGSWRWSPVNPNQLLYIPVRTGSETSNAVWSYNFNANQAQRLTNPATNPLVVFGDEWQVAPDGKSIVYRNANDNSLWMVSFS